MIVQMIADKVPGKHLAPARGTAERYQLQEWLNFINSELHKNFGPLFNPVLPDDAKTFFKDRAMGKFKYARQPAGRQGLPDGQAVHRRRRLSVHDAALGRPHEVRPLRNASNLMAYKARVAARPNVQDALRQEGLMKAA